MAENSKIAWTDHTFNPWVGCTKVSPACVNCYAYEKWAKRAGRAHLFEGAPPERTSAANWREPLVWNRRAVATDRRERVFCASLGDVFDDRVPCQWREDLWGLIRSTPALDWLILTKRPQNFEDMLPYNWLEGWHNVWLGVTVEDVETARTRIPVLHTTPAARHFLSCEPLLEDIVPAEDNTYWLDGIDLVIVGGESAPADKCRTMAWEWAERIRVQCGIEKVPFFMKQMSGSSKAERENIPGFLLVREFPGYEEVPTV